MEVVLIITFVAFLFPVVTYVTIKMGTYAFYKGRELFFKEFLSNKESNDGKSS